MSGARNRLDPVVTAEAGIAGSKDLMAAVARDLAQHQRWLADYRLDEKRHARRLMLHELIYQLELGRRQLVREARWLALTSLRLARSIASFLSRTAASAVFAMRRFVTASDAWARPRAYGLARTLWRWLTTFWDWIGVHSRILARTVAATASTGFAWFAGKSRVFAIALRRLLLAFGAWTSVQAGKLTAQSRAHALALRLWLSASGASALAQAGRQAQASRKTAVVASSWLMARSRALATALRHRVARTWRRGRALARVLARNSFHGARIASAWTAATSRGAATSTRAAALQLQRNLSTGAVWSSAKAKATARSSVAASRATYSWAASWAALRMRNGSNGRPPRQAANRAEPPCLGRQAKHGAHLLRAEAGTFSLSSCWLSRRRPARSHAGRASS